MDTRRRFLQTGSLCLAAAALPRWLRAAERIAPTAEIEEGPFYPAEIPLDHDNDLLRFADLAASAVGVPLSLRGRVLDRHGRTVPDVRIEIWQCDAHGRYHYVDDPSSKQPLDAAFQGYGSFTTRADGAYRFRTIRPVAYPGRTPHIHFKLRGEGFDGLTTQMFVAGEPLNAKDGIYQSIHDRRARDALTVALSADPDGGLRGTFDLVLDADGRFEQAAAIA
jgi:protocatechuate 3,4-dioxygenase beta subunit